ncbi:hypothetical protein IWQ49_003058 [Labrenzia sp. EL_126]|nr:hypothetical protein [Labrenzia sp. EL_126]
MGDNLTEKIANWLSDTGYPLEMRVRSELTRLQSETKAFSFANAAYTDEDSGKVREGGDAVIHTHRVAQLQKDGVWYQFRTYVFAVIECKQPKKPWVAFLRPLQPGYQMIHCMTSDEEGSEKLRWNMSRAEFRNQLEKQLGRDSLLLAPNQVAYSLVEFKADQNNNKIYNATQQVLEASQGVAREHTNYFAEPKHKNVTLFGAFSFIVTSGEIFTCKLSDEGAPIVEQVQTAVYIDERGLSSRTRFVRLMTEAFFNEHFAKILSDMQLVNGTLEKIILKLDANETTA